MVNSGVNTNLALLFHEGSTESLTFASNTLPVRKSTTFVTVHDIKRGRKGPVLGAGRLMSESDKAAICDLLLGNEETADVWWPSNLLMMNAQKLVWYVVGRKRPMYFINGEKSFQLNLVWPSLIFCYSHARGLRIVAYAGRGRPTSTQRCYHAPLWNIGADTKLCVGSNLTTNVIAPESMPVWEDAIYESNFSHANHDKLLRPAKGGRNRQSPSYLAFLRQKAKSGEPIRAREMVPLGMSVEAWIAE